MARLFYLENSIGERKPLNGENNVWLKNPTGLGMNTRGEFADLRKGFFSRVSGDIEPQGEIDGDLEFKSGGDPYENYRELINWLALDYDFYFVYNPYGSKEYYRTIEVNYLTKTEKECINLLYIPFSFACITPWYILLPSQTVIEPVAADFKRYNFTYNYVYPASRQAQAVEVNAIGHIPAAFTLEYTGALTNPSIILTGTSTGTVYGQCDISETLITTDKLIFSSEYGASKVQKEDSSGTISDLISDVDISKNPFPHIPLSEPCDLSIESGATMANTATVKVYNYYRSV